MRVVAGIYRSRLLKYVSNEVTRPTTDKNKEMIFNTLGQFFDGGLCLDLFSGTGSLGIEALSRGMKYAYMCEINTDTYNILKDNLQTLKIDNATYEKMDFKSFLKKYNNIKFDLVLLDPPYPIANELRGIIKYMTIHKMFKKGCKVLLEMPKEMVYVPEELKYLKEKTGAASRFVFLEYEGE